MKINERERERERERENKGVQLSVGPQIFGLLQKCHCISFWWKWKRPFFWILKMKTEYKFGNQIFYGGSHKKLKINTNNTSFSSSQIPFPNSYSYQCHVLLFFEKEISTIHWTFHLNKGFNELIHLKFHLCKSLNELFIFLG